MRTREHGQALVFMTIAMIPALIMVALIVDGGNAWAQQRVAQNGSDSSADGGATILGQRLGESVNPLPGHDSAYWDLQVKNAVESNASANGVVVKTGQAATAFYTDICGNLLRPDGTAATSTVDAAKVGAGALPVSAGAPAPTCPSATVGPVAGVEAIGTRTFGTFISGILGRPTWSATAQAIAVAGYLQSGLMLPIAFNVNVVYCDNQGDATQSNPSVTWPKYQTYVLPICKHGPGNVGWIDWSPPNGGTNELVGCIQTPCNGDITLPQWMNVAQPGGTSSSQVEDALRAHDGEIVLLPQFDGTCSSAPDQSQVNTSAPFGCTSGYGDMHGSQTWYRIKQVAAFQLCSPATCSGYHGSYTNGNNKTECNNSQYAMPAPDTAKATDCLVGQFVDFVDSGTVGGSANGQWGTTGAIGVQLIK
jgi:hypothetical protein